MPTLGHPWRPGLAECNVASIRIWGTMEFLLDTVNDHVVVMFSLYTLIQLAPKGCERIKSQVDGVRWSEPLLSCPSLGVEAPT